MQHADHSDSAAKENDPPGGAILDAVTVSRSPEGPARRVDDIRRVHERADAGEAVDPVELCTEDPHLASARIRGELKANQLA